MVKQIRVYKAYVLNTQISLTPMVRAPKLYAVFKGTNIDCTSILFYVQKFLGTHTLQEINRLNSPPLTCAVQTHTHTLVYRHHYGASDIVVSYFKGFNSEHSHGWYLKQPPKVLELSTHTCIHSYLYTPQQKCTDWSQCRATEKVSGYIGVYCIWGKMGINSVYRPF